jgi:GH15 family glucan-1,4-alpha-glucosidase
VWTSQQLDETALPVVLARWLGRNAAGDWDNIRAAADYLQANGPRSGQERWENQDGYSPNTIATEIAALVCAADVARRNGEPDRAADYERTAADWQKRVEGWTATDNGPYSPRAYYLRVTKDAKPNSGTTYTLGDNFPRPVDQREIVDNSFLGLVLFGVKPWNDRAANDGMMLPEQVWDGRPPNEDSGEGTRSATPLAWTHAAFVRLAWSIQQGAPIERPSIVACRYQKQLCGS